MIKKLAKPSMDCLEYPSSAAGTNPTVHLGRLCEFPYLPENRLRT